MPNHTRFWLFTLICITCVSTFLGCGSIDRKVDGIVEPDTRTPVTPYLGPEAFNMTIDSLVTVNQFQPILISGYGVVVNLPGTGSADMPATLRPEMIRLAQRYGVQNPEALLNSRNTAVVLVYGIVPPGAKAGTRFDLYVTALEQSETVSIADGDLWTTDLAINGENLAFGRPVGFTVGSAQGPIFSDPLITIDPKATDFDRRSGLVIGGGSVKADTKLSLNLREASFTRSREIANRINGRFPRGPEDKFDMAVPQTDTTIEINVLEEFKDDPRYMVELMLSLYMNPTNRFQTQKARELTDYLKTPGNAQEARKVMLAWLAMGRSQLKYIRSLYKDPNPLVQMTALTYGSNIGDSVAATPLFNIAKNADSSGRNEEASAMLSSLFIQSPDDFRVERMLEELLNHQNPKIRLIAVSGLIEGGSETIFRRVIANKFEIILVPSSQPMIYATQTGKPRIVVFDDQMRLISPMFHTIWKDRLILNNREITEPLGIMFKAFVNEPAIKREIPPYISNLIMYLGASRAENSPVKGFDLKYSQIVAVLFDLAKHNLIPAKAYLQPSSLSERVTRETRDSLGPGGSESGRDATD